MRASTSRFKWYRDAVWLIRDYPELKAKRADLHTQSMTAQYGDIPHGSGAQRTTENIALREMAPLDEERFRVVDEALDEIRRLPDGQTVVRIVELMDWKRTHTADGVAMMMHMDTRTVIRKREKLIKAVARKCLWI